MKLLVTPVRTILTSSSRSPCSSRAPRRRKQVVKEIKDRGELRVGYATADPARSRTPPRGRKGIARIMEGGPRRWASSTSPSTRAGTCDDRGPAGGKYDVAAALNRR